MPFCFLGLILWREKMRKQVYDLTLEDLAYSPVWEFGLDEEGIPGRDECTVRPRADIGVFAPSRWESSAAMVKAEFISRCDKVHYGFCTPATKGDLSSMHPVIVTANGQVGFYHGAVPPSPAELATGYARLETTPEELFPIRFRCLVPAPGLVTSGTIPAHIWLTVDSGTPIKIVENPNVLQLVLFEVPAGNGKGLWEAT